MFLEVSPFLSLCEGLVVERIEHTATTIAIAVTSTSLVASCPQCQEPSKHIHGHYQRTMADLPCSGRQVTLHLKVRKFVCLNLACPRVIFAERFDALVQPRARQTSRLQERLRTLGFATSGEAAARLAPQFGLSGSPATILRQIKAPVAPSAAPATKVGLDDFAFRRGLCYGTIIVDLETHRVLDLLPDRTVAPVATWLKARPWIERISRDRGADSAAAARVGAPQAIQVADRWHVLRNLNEALALVLTRQQPDIRKASRAAAQVPPPEPEPLATDAAASKLLPPPAPVQVGHASRGPALEKVQQARRAARYDRYQQVVALREHSLSSREIAAQVGISARTVRAWVAQGAFPEARQRRRRPSLIDPFEAYVVQRWQAGCHNGAQIYREMTAHGYPGTMRALYRYLVRLYDACPPSASSKPARQKKPLLPSGPYDHFSAKRGAWLFFRPPAELTPAEQQEVAFLCQVPPQLEAAYQLTQRFVTLMKERQADRLEDWLKGARGSHIPELGTFGRGLARDQAAVVASLKVSYSQGIAEGHVNRLQLIKRTMYGRAGFSLLRQRVISRVA